MIRQYKILDDFKSLKAITEVWHDECNSEEFGLEKDFGIFEKDLQELVAGQNTALLVAEKNDVIVGIMGISIFNSPIGKQKIANEHYWFVLPEYRNTRIPLQLINYAQDWAKNRGCTHFILNASMLASNLHDKVCRIYEKIGLRKFETTYIKKIGD